MPWIVFGLVDFFMGMLVLVRCQYVAFVIIDSIGGQSLVGVEF